MTFLSLMHDGTNQLITPSLMWSIYVDREIASYFITGTKTFFLLLPSTTSESVNLPANLHHSHNDSLKLLLSCLIQRSCTMTLAERISPTAMLNLINHIGFSCSFIYTYVKYAFHSSQQWQISLPCVIVKGLNIADLVWNIGYLVWNITYFVWNIGTIANYWIGEQRKIFRHHLR